MSNKTRKHIWPVSLVMSIAIIGVLAAFLVLATNPGETQAHGEYVEGEDHCQSLSDEIAHDIGGSAFDHTCTEGPATNTAPMAGAAIADQSISTGGTGTVQSTITDADADDTLTWSVASSDDTVATAQVDNMGEITVTAVADGTATITVTASDGTASDTQTFTVTVRDPGMDEIKSDSTTASGSPEIQLTIQSLPMEMRVGSSIVLYLEDDFQEPDSIPMSSVYLVAVNQDGTTTTATGSGSRVYVTQPVKLKTGAYFDEDKKDIAIRVSVPDMCTTDTPDCQSANGLDADQKVTVVIESDSGIKNPSEAGTHSVSFDLLGTADPIPSASNVRDRNDARRAADPSMELTVKTVAKITLSDVDNKRGYEMTVTGSGFNDGTTAGVYVFHDANGDPDDKSTWPSCETIVTQGTEVGGSLVGSDDKAAVTFEVTAPTFKPGKMNYLCMVDGEGRMSDTDVEDFNLEPSIRVSPTEVSSGDTVTVFAQDFTSGNFGGLKLAGQVVNPKNDVPTGAGRLPYVPVSISGETAIFDMPGGLKGTVRVDATWAGVTKDTKITVAPSTVTASQTDVLPNDSVTLTGNGFAGKVCIPASAITLDDVQITLDDESDDNCDTANKDGDSDTSGVLTSNAGQFVATIHLAPAIPNASDPTLIAGRHTLDVEDDKGFTGSVILNIAEPSITVTPDVAGPRDYISVSGQNWPVDNPENPLEEAVTITVKDNTARGRMYSAFADTAGRFTVEHQVHRGVAIPSTIQVEVKYDDTIVKIATFDVPVATITVDPGEAQPGDNISISATNMPVYTDATSVKIGGSEIGNLNAHTDRDGNITVADVLVPGLDPGTYSVQLKVKDTVAIGELKVLAESAAGGAPAELPGAVENLGDSLVAIFHFDDVGKSWSFHDPRPEFAELNTLTEMSNGEAYWILVSETMDEVVLNNKVRSLTCRGDDCWNLEVW